MSSNQNLPVVPLQVCARNVLEKEAVPPMRRSQIHTLMEQFNFP
jgi:hypothetical protein